MVKFKVWNLRQDMSHDLSRVLIFLIYISLVTTDVLITADWTIIKTFLELRVGLKWGEIEVEPGFTCWLIFKINSFGGISQSSISS